MSRYRELLENALDMLNKAGRGVLTLGESLALQEKIEKELAKPEPVIIDLKHCSYDQLADAVSRSNWIPEQYYVNDWINDCARYLEFGFPYPPQQKPLSDDEILKIIDGGDSLNEFTLINFARAIEKAHKIGN